MAATSKIQVTCFLLKRPLDKILRLSNFEKKNVTTEQYGVWRIVILTKERIVLDKVSKCGLVKTLLASIMWG